MIDWRIRGYVPDSDDEDDFQDLPAPQRRDEAEPVIDRLVKAASVDTKHQPQQGNSTTTSLDGGAGESTVTRLERTLSHGLQTIRDVLTSTTLSSIQHDDVDDSPLSSPPKSLPNSPSAYNLFGNNLGRSENYDVTQLQLHDNEQYAPRRSLRARAPIQEHPYMLEDARYRQLMKGVGIKPINVPTVDRDIGVAHQDEDSQQSENLESYRPEESFDFQVPSSPLSLQSFPKGIESQEETTANDEMTLSDADNDLPDLTQILSERDRTAKRLYRSKDRSFRSAKNTTSMPLASTKVSNKPANDSLEVIVPGLLSPNRDFQVPPSPPRSDDLLAFEPNNVQERKRLSTRPGKGLNTPQALPTPLVSSGEYHRKRPLTVVSSSESSSSDEADSDLELTPQPEKDDSQGIQSIKQRLKGTLPASWVKIDMQNQGSNRPKHRSLPQPVNISNERGVARKVSGGRARGHEQVIGSSLPFGSAEDSDLDSEEAVHPIPQRRHDKTFAVVRPVVDADDVLDKDPMQGDEVGYALPQLTREAAPTQRQRQSRLHDGWAVLSHRSAADTSAAGLSGRNRKGPAASSRKKVATTKRKKFKHKMVPPQMLMADAPGIRELDRKDQPQFLKLAARQARKVTWRPQRTVSRKIFLLASKDDTKDVVDQISVWQQRQNTGRPQQNPVAHSHVSTNTISDAASLSTTSNANFAITKSKHQLHITEDIESLKRSTSALLATVSVQKSHRSSASVDADQVESVQPVTGDRAAPKATQIKSLFAHRNRSGPGQLLNRIPEPRIAQIETSQRSDIHGVNLPFRNVVTLKRQLQRSSLIATKGMSPVITESVSVQTAKPRQPRKRVPRMSAIPTARMEHEDVFDI